MEREKELTYSKEESKRIELIHIPHKLLAVKVRLREAIALQITNEI